MKCEVRQQSETDAAKWNEFVLSNSMGWAQFLYEKIGVDRYVSYINRSFAIVDTDNDDEILFVQQLHQTNNHPILAKMRLRREKLTSRWGFVVKDNLPRKHFRKLKECYENYIDGYIREHHIKRFTMDLAPMSQWALEDKSGVNPAIFFNFAPRIRYTYVVDLSKPDDKMLADCEETTRQAVRKIEASGKYEIVEASSCEEDCRTFIDLHKETYTRTNDTGDIKSDSYHETIFFKLIPAGIARVFFLKEKDSALVLATVAILIYKNTAYYWWGDSRNEIEVGVNKYLLFKIICMMREAFGKTGYFETGGAYVHLRKGKYKGLNDFKKCFGTFLHPIYQGTYTKLRH
ncbi:MAG: GNAT family N-acetyltransferase [Bacteroidales bacterium]|nr:GNAT family N-acetyltransferase [Bacteroidales bacterium]